MKTTATADRILNSAREVFLEKGFDGASINDIAGHADIHKSLIYHYFKDKAGLWVAVKESLLETETGKSLKDLDFSSTSFRQFLNDFITFRYEFYRKNKDIARLIAWQRVENEQDQIAGLNRLSSVSMLDKIRHFQQTGEVRPNLDPEMVLYFIMTSASMPFMDKPAFLQGKNQASQHKAYLEMLIESLFAAFANKTTP